MHVCVHPYILDIYISIYACIDALYTEIHPLFDIIRGYSLFRKKSAPIVF